MGVGVVVLAMVFTGFSFLWFLFLIHDVVGVEVSLLSYVVHPFAALFGFSGEDGGEVFVVAVWVVGYL